jgi:hypothetical protein
MLRLKNWPPAWAAAGVVDGSLIGSGPFVAHAAMFSRFPGQVVHGNEVNKKFYEVDKNLIINLLSTS